MHTGFYNREQLAMELLLAELKRQHDMYDAETRRFSKIPSDQITRKRWDYHFRKTDTILKSLKDLDRKIDEKLGITKGEENGSTVGGRGSVRPGQRDDGRAGSLASEEAADGGGR
jgi:hypothetical protein